VRKLGGCVDLEPPVPTVQRFTPLFADAGRPGRHATGDRWFVDETYVRAAGRWRYLYRAVDQYGQVIDVLRSEQRDTAAARRFFVRALRHGPAPVELTTDKAGPYPRVLDELVPAAAHVTEQYGTDEIVKALAPAPAAACSTPAGGGSRLAGGHPDGHGLDPGEDRRSVAAGGRGRPRSEEQGSGAWPCRAA
jgi:transposase, IS6 family